MKIKLTDEERRLRRKEYSARYYARHKEQCKRSATRWRKANPDKYNAAGVRFKLRHRNEILEKKRLYNAGHSKERAEYAKQWRKRNSDKMKIYSEKRKNGQYREVPHDVVRARHSKWRHSNPERIIAAKNNRRARKIGNGGKFTSLEFKMLCAMYGNQCVACGKTGIKLTADHVVPLFVGGSNDISNIQPMCKSCNSSKNTQSIDYRSNFYWADWT